MSKAHDKLESIKLTPENTSELTRLLKSYPEKPARPSRSKLANYAVEVGISKIKRP